MKNILFLIVISALFYACAKKGEPFSQICMIEKTYHVGDTVRLDNCSKKYEKQRWLLPDSTTSTGDYVYYVANHPGQFVFRLYVTNSKFVNDFESSKTVTIQP